VVILSQEYIRKECPMEELHILLQRWQAGGVQLVPVLHGVTVEELVDIQGQYQAGAWSAAGVQPANETLEGWAADLKLLQSCTMIGRDQVLLCMQQRVRHRRGTLPCCCTSTDKAPLSAAHASTWQRRLVGLMELEMVVCPMGRVWGIPPLGSSH
jgi:hypothetical protein